MLGACRTFLSVVVQAILTSSKNNYAGVAFGDVISEVAKTEYAPGDIVAATFQSACPRNNLRTGDTFLKVQRRSDDGAWHTV